MPIHDKARAAVGRAVSGLRRKIRPKKQPNQLDAPKKQPNQLALPGKKQRTGASASTPTGNSNKGPNSARAAAQQRFDASGGVTSKAPSSIPKISLLRRATKATVPTAVAGTLAGPAGETLGEAAFNVANPGYDPNFNPATSFASNLKESLAPVTQAVTDLAVGDPGNAGPDFFPNPNAPKAPGAVDGEKPRAGLRAASPQDTGGTVSTVPAVTPSGATPALPALPRIRPPSTSSTFSEKQRLRSAKIGVGRLRSGFLDADQVAAQNKAAQSELEAAQGATGLRVAAENAQFTQQTRLQGAQARAGATTAKANAADGLSFRDRLALYKQQYTEQRDVIGDDQQATKGVFKSIDDDFGDNIRGATIEKAMFEASQDPNYDLGNTAVGRAALSELKSAAVDATNEDRWLWERLFGVDTLGAAEKADISFKGWSYNPETDEIVSDIGTEVDMSDFSNENDAFLVKLRVIQENKDEQQPQGLR